jgi:hypothetical protein
MQQEMTNWTPMVSALAKRANGLDVEAIGMPRKTRYGGTNDSKMYLEKTSIGGS